MLPKATRLAEPGFLGNELDFFADLSVNPWGD